MSLKLTFKQLFNLLLFGLLCTHLSVSVAATSDTNLANPKVKITADIPWVDIQYKGKTIRIQRNQDTGNMVDLDFAVTSRPCPPYCIQPMTAAPGVETVGEIEVIQYIKRMSEGDSNIVLIDSREPKWLQKGMIPGAINIPWKKLFAPTASEEGIAEIMQFNFAAVQLEQIWNFQNAKTLVFYCNGPWCGQSATNIRALLTMGYPAHKLKWYRGGIQSWKMFGLTVIAP